MPLPFCREHPGMRVLQLSLWHRAAGVGLRSGGVFIVQVVYVMRESSVAARAWRLPLHRALASPKQPLSSSMGLGCHPPPLPLSLQGKPHSWLQGMDADTRHQQRNPIQSKSSVLEMLNPSVLFPLQREATKGSWSWLPVCTGATHTIPHCGVGPEAILLPGPLTPE